MDSRSVRRLGIAVGIVGAVIALGSCVGVMLGHGVGVLLWLIPEGAGLVLVLIGLHAWIDWRVDE